MANTNELRRRRTPAVVPLRLACPLRLGPTAASNRKHDGSGSRLGSVLVRDAFPVGRPCPSEGVTAIRHPLRADRPITIPIATSPPTTPPVPNRSPASRADPGGAVTMYRSPAGVSATWTYSMTAVLVAWRDREGCAGPARSSPAATRAITPEGVRYRPPAQSSPPTGSGARPALPVGSCDSSIRATLAVANRTRSRPSKSRPYSGTPAPPPPLDSSSSRSRRKARISSSEGSRSPKWSFTAKMAPMKSF